MRNYSLLLFILALPALAALGHDIWLAYNNTAYDIAERFYLSDLGWVWKEYSPESMEWAKFAFEPTTWQTYIDPVLEQKTVLIGAVPLIIALITIIVFKIFGYGAFEGQGLFTPRIRKSKNTDFSFEGEQKKARTKYKRK